MSYHEYRLSRAIEMEDYPFYALIMASMKKADSDNLKKLKEAFPSVWQELYERYNSPGGKLAGEI